ncbi:hypothetical protein L917_04868 [Phytophthora nicotianae]|uniref:SET domain-containing protein n=1 Tax=Phytophthora nicotianae TaxID=4792 RepID=W2LKD6_PHYNI|nr:hypothetical protein L917_04868 [Phytophthora nicotianae]
MRTCHRTFQNNRPPRARTPKKPTATTRPTMTLPRRVQPRLRGCCRGLRVVTRRVSAFRPPYRCRRWKLGHLLNGFEHPRVLPLPHPCFWEVHRDLHRWLVLARNDWNDVELVVKLPVHTHVLVALMTKRTNPPPILLAPLGRQTRNPVVQSCEPSDRETRLCRFGGLTTSPNVENSTTRWPLLPVVPHFGSCQCSEPCRADSCRNALMNLYCNVNCCPYEGMCGNGLNDSPKVYLARSLRTSSLGVVAVEDIAAGEVLGQYLGEIEHLSMNRHNRPRNTGYRLVLRTRPKCPSHPVRVDINAERMGGLMRYVNHSCDPVAKFVEVGNDRRTTVVVVTTEQVRRGEEVTADYGDDLWFACRCYSASCPHRDIQASCDP